MRYFLVTFFRKPGGAIDEQAGFSKNIKPADLQTCNIIMDYKEQKVIKCVIEGKIHPTDFDKLHEYYMQVYPTLIEQLKKIQ